MMLNSRFGRSYELEIITPSNQIITIKPDLRIVFDIKKSINGQPNTANIQIYNLNETNRKLIVKDEDVFGIVNDKTFTITLKAGYEKAEIIFKGKILKASTVRSGADLITSIQADDGISELYTNKVVSSQSREQIIKELKSVQKGKITEEKTTNRRDVVLVGSPRLLLENLIEDNQSYFIDDGVINILDKNEVLTQYITLVNSQTGLIRTPNKKDGDIIFQTLLNPLIKIGCLVKVESLYSPHLNGIYRVHTLSTNGDFNGSSWEQEVIGNICNDYKVVK